MNVEQFREFMQSMASMFQPLRDEVPIQPLIVHFDQFDENKENWSTYVLRFENFAAMKKVTDDKLKCQMFLNCIAPKVYTTATTLVAPKSISEIKYSELIEILNKQLSPKQNNLVIQHRILNTVQSDQTVNEYAAKLKQLG